MDLSTLAQDLLTAAKARGCDECEVYAIAGDSATLTAYEGQIDRCDVSQSCGISLRIRQNGVVGSAFSEQLSPEMFPWLIDRARAQTEYLEEKQAPFFEGSRDYVKIEQDLQPLQAYTPEQKVEHVLALENLCRADARVERVLHCTLSSSLSNSVLANTAGLHTAQEHGLCYAYAQPLLPDSNTRREGFAYRVGFAPEALQLSALAEEAVAFGASFLGAKPCAGGQYPIVFGPDAFIDLFSTFMGVFSAENAQKGLSLLAGREGQCIAAKCVTLVDDPHLKNGLASRSFDGEGVATYRKSIIENGVFRVLLHNRKTAEKAGCATTANARRAGYSGGLGIAPTNCFLQPGTLTQAELFAQAQTGLYVVDVSGLHAGCNTVSGDFSVLVKGFLIEHGRLGQPVVQVTVAGNFYTMLQDIAAVGSDLRFGMPQGGCYGSPSILTSPLAVAGD